MKKIIALMMLCLLLCACCATAFAATVTFKDNNNQTKVFTATADSQFTLPSYADCEFTQPSGEVFVGWQVGTSQVYYKPGAKIDVIGEMNISARYMPDDKDIVEVQYKSNKYNDNNLVAYYPVVKDQPMDLLYPYNCGFGSSYASSFEFDHWLVEGECFKGYGDPGEEMGWLFARAIAAEMFRGEMEAEEVITVQGDVTITAVWSGDDNDDNNGDNGGGNDGGGNNDDDDDDDNNGGGNNGGGQGGNNGGNAGGNNGGGQGGNGVTADMPSTGDNSMRIDFLFVVMLVSLVGLRLMAKKRIN